MNVMARVLDHPGLGPTSRGGCKAPYTAGILVCPRLSISWDDSQSGCSLGYLTELFQLQTLCSSEDDRSYLTSRRGIANISQ
jgi:hypothetical protein